MGVEKEKALEIALAQIEKQFGKGAVMKLGDAAAKISVSTIPTGCIELDYALGVGGVPRGRIIEIYGPESSGKTTIALHVIAQSQKMGGTAAFIDAEHALDPVYAGNLGVNVDELYVSQPDTGEQALEITEALVRSGAIDVIVVDSVAALVTRAEIEGEMGDAHVGVQAGTDESSAVTRDACTGYAGIGGKQFIDAAQYLHCRVKRTPLAGTVGRVDDTALFISQNRLDRGGACIDAKVKPGRIFRSSGKFIKSNSCRGMGRMAASELPEFCGIFEKRGKRLFVRSVGRTRHIIGKRRQRFGCPYTLSNLLLHTGELVPMK